MTMRKKMKVFFFLAVAMALVALAATPAHAEFITPTATYTTDVAERTAEGTLSTNNLSTSDETATYAPHGDPGAVAAPGWMYYTNGGMPTSIGFDLGGTYNLSKAYVWNLNQTATRATLTMTIDVSSDNVSWTTEVGGTNTLRNVPGGTSIPVDDLALAVADVRYVRFNIFESQGDGNVGLGAVRFEGILQTIAPLFITPTNATASSTYHLSPPVAANMINSSGLNQNNAWGTHSDARPGMWMSANSTLVADQWAVFDLGNDYDLINAYVWQFTERTSWNTRTMDIYVSDDDVSYTKVGGTVTLKTTLADNEPAEIVELIASKVRYVKFDILTAGSGSVDSNVGLAEVRFEGAVTIPPPAGTVIVVR
jgi:hypothetical protein